MQDRIDYLEANHKAKEALLAEFEARNKIILAASARQAEENRQREAERLGTDMEVDDLKQQNEELKNKNKVTEIAERQTRGSHAGHKGKNGCTGPRTHRTNQQEAGQATAKFEQLAAQLTEALNIGQQAQEEREDLSARLQKQQQETDALLNDLRDLAAERDRLRIRSADFDQATEVATRSQAPADRTKAYASSLEQRLGVLGQKLQQATAEAEAERNRYAAESDEQRLARSERRAKHLRQNEEALRGLLAKSEMSNDKAGAHINALQRARQEQEEMLGETREQLAKSRSVVANLETALRSDQARTAENIQHLQAALTEREAEKKALEEEVGSLETELGVTKSNLTEITQKVSELGKWYAQAFTGYVGSAITSMFYQAQAAQAEQKHLATEERNRVLAEHGRQLAQSNTELKERANKFDKVQRAFQQAARARSQGTAAGGLPTPRMAESGIRAFENKDQLDRFARTSLFTKLATGADSDLSHEGLEQEYKKILSSSLARDLNQQAGLVAPNHSRGTGMRAGGANPAPPRGVEASDSTVHSIKVASGGGGDGGGASDGQRATLPTGAGDREDSKDREGQHATQPMDQEPQPSKELTTKQLEQEIMLPIKLHMRRAEFHVFCA
eukprot:g41986.t1